MKRQRRAPEIAGMYETPLTLEEFERRTAAPPPAEEVAEFFSLGRDLVG